MHAVNNNNNNSNLTCKAPVCAKKDFIGAKEPINGKHTDKFTFLDINNVQSHAER